MYEVTVEDVFSSAHRLRNYKGKCESMHGHNWKVQVTAGGESPDSNGLLIDFQLLKESLKKVLDVLDHHDLNKLPFFRKKNPTSENICFYIYKNMEDVLKKHPVKVTRVTVWESDKQCASYFEAKAGGV